MTEAKGDKPRAHLLALRINELSGVDRPCHAPALVSLMKRRPGPISKQAAIGHTDEIEGHQHSIHTDGADLFTSHNTAAGSEYGHAHTVIRGADGALTVLADSGHTHAITDDESTQAAVVAAAVSGESPRGAIAASMNPQPEMTTMTLDEALAEIADLKAKLADLDKSKEDLEGLMGEAEKRATLTDAQRAHHKSLDKADAKAFLAKSFAEREAVLGEIAKANAEVYKSERTGQVFRKSDDPRLVEMAKQADQLATDIAKRDEAIEKAEIATIAKAHLGSLAGNDETHAYIVKAIRKGGGDEAMVTAALATLKAGNALGEAASVAKGAGGSEVVSGPQAQLDQAIAKYATDHKVSRPEATKAVFQTDEGRRLYAAANK